MTIVRLFDWCRNLSDEELLKELEAAREDERSLLIRFLVCLSELDRRHLAQGQGFPSPFNYCTERLKMSKDEACRGVRAARSSALYPAILSYLADGVVSLTVISMLSSHFSIDNVSELLERAKHKSVREIERLVAELAPKPDVRETIRRLPERDASSPGGGTAPVFEPMSQFSLSAAVELPIFGPPSKMEPLAPCRIRFAFTATEEFLNKIERCRRLLRHKYPAGRLEEIFDELARNFLKKRDPDLKTRPAPPRATKPFRREIPQWVKDEVWKRDGGRCSFVSTEGRLCASQDFLEFDHVIPWALGGLSNTPGNIRLLCRSHNQHLGQKVFSEFHEPEGLGGNFKGDTANSITDDLG